jgi:hypothetical protein
MHKGAGRANGNFIGKLSQVCMRRDHCTGQKVRKSGKQPPASKLEKRRAPMVGERERRVRGVIVPAGKLEKAASASCE